jgi:hypothetical protein
MCVYMCDYVYVCVHVHIYVCAYAIGICVLCACMIVYEYSNVYWLCIEIQKYRKHAANIYTQGELLYGSAVCNDEGQFGIILF